jgi:putative ABC transport system permease protein
MYFRILKRDLKRKKTMNVILLIFIILASMFVASSVNNIITVATGLDGFFETAEVADFFVIKQNIGNNLDVSEALQNIEAVESFEKDDLVYFDSDQLYYEGEKLKDMTNTGLLQSFEKKHVKLFDSENRELTSVEPGTVWVANKILNMTGLKVGDTIEIRMDDVTKELRIAGVIKDAYLGGTGVTIARFLVSDSDFEAFHSNETIREFYGSEFFYITGSDTKAIKTAVEGLTDANIQIAEPKSTLTVTFLMDMLIACVLLVVSVVLVLVAFVVLKFTISFTLAEEFREIGVMKAIGLPNTRIRGMYMVKYLMMALVGACIGFVLSIPMGNMLLDSVSKSMVLKNEGGLLINGICSLAVVLIILGFCYLCTGKVKKFTPVDAIRSGTTGERFKKKGILRLSKSPAKPAAFMAANDVLSSPRRYLTIVLTFFLCLSLVLVLVNTVNTMNSEELLPALGSAKSHVFYQDSDDTTDRITEIVNENGQEVMKNRLEEMEKILADNGMEAHCFADVVMKLTLSHGDNTVKSLINQGVGITMDQFKVFEGTAPQNINEIALTKVTAEELGVRIGDTVTIHHVDGAKEYIVTALFQTMNNLGEGARIHEDVKLDYSQVSGASAYQINFLDDPSNKEIDRRIEKLKEIFGTEDIFTGSEYTAMQTGLGEPLKAVSTLVLTIVLVIIILITVLMEYSFLTKERGEIAILKAVGFSNRALVIWHTLRFALVSAIATALALICTVPFTKLCVNPIFKMTGATYGIEYRIDLLQIFLLYPALVLVTTIVSALLTSLRVRSVSASECSNID